jgi:hypothetical protein
VIYGTTGTKRRAAPLTGRGWAPGSAGRSGLARMMSGGVGAGPGAGASIQGMPSVIKTVTWDCSDALVVARFWAAALGSDVDEDSTVTRAFVEAAGWGAPNMWRPAGGAGRDSRATRRDAALTVMRDPEGNGFCVKPGPAG